ncbi:MAG: hypothetical protein O3A00_12385 [Planctomycetota bacterium]|nr:hypothetical protein [Planctomycetota bacterium]
MVGPGHKVILVAVGVLVVGTYVAMQQTTIDAQENAKEKPGFFARFKLPAPKFPWGRKSSNAKKTQPKQAIQPQIEVKVSGAELVGNSQQSTSNQIDSRSTSWQRPTDPTRSNDDPGGGLHLRPAFASPSQDERQPFSRTDRDWQSPRVNAFGPRPASTGFSNPSNSTHPRTSIASTPNNPIRIVGDQPTHGWRPTFQETLFQKPERSKRTPAAPRNKQEQPVADADPINSPKPIPRTLRVPIDAVDDRGQIEVNNQDGKIWLVVRNAPVGDVLGVLAQQQGLNIVTGQDVSSRISVTLSAVSFEDALDGIMAVAGYTWVQRNKIILVTRIDQATKLSPSAQGREVRVFPLDFVTSMEINKVVTGLLSPVGQSFASQTDPKNNRRAKELLVIEDLPQYVERIANYIAQVDMPPKQVMIEAHILQVTLQDDSLHGINWAAVAEAAGSQVSFATTGFANPLATPASFFTINGTDMNAVLEALKTTTDAKTLAKPKVLATNGQEARIQIGQKLGYFVTTTTQTSTLQNVQFLETGVVLRVTPFITSDGSVLMSIKPQVSTGSVSESTGLPSEETTEADTTALLPNGRGMVIGGLINENDVELQSKVPLLGDMWLVGRMFQRRTMSKKRNEIIIVLVPRIVPYGVAACREDEIAVDRTSTPLLEGPLRRVHRPWEADLPDAMHDPRQFRLDRFPHFWRNLWAPFPHSLEYYMPTMSDQNPWIVETHRAHNSFPPQWLHEDQHSEVHQDTSWYDDESIPSAPAATGT